MRECVTVQLIAEHTLPLRWPQCQPWLGFQPTALCR